SVAGPCRLSSFNPDGTSTSVPNVAYSGPVKARLAQFVEVPFTTESAEYNVLQAKGTGGNQIDVGYLPTIDAPPTSSPNVAGRTPVPGYSLSRTYTWGPHYFPLNYQSTTGNGPILKQLYFRQALQYLMNQAAVIAGPLKGYGVPTVGPVGSEPVTSYLSSTGKAGDPWPYNPSKAKSLLTSH